MAVKKMSCDLTEAEFRRLIDTVGRVGLSRLLGVSGARVGQMKRQYNMTRPEDYTTKFTETFEMPEDELREMYTGEKMTIPDIAKALGCTQPTVIKNLKRLGIYKSRKDRKKTEQVAEKVEEKKAPEAEKPHRIVTKVALKEQNATVQVPPEPIEEPPRNRASPAPRPPLQPVPVGAPPARPTPVPEVSEDEYDAPVEMKEPPAPKRPTVSIFDGVKRTLAAKGELVKKEAELAKREAELDRKEKENRERYFKDTKVDIALDKELKGTGNIPQEDDDDAQGPEGNDPTKRTAGDRPKDTGGDGQPHGK